jgi:hypothetical protein
MPNSSSSPRCSSSSNVRVAENAVASITSSRRTRKLKRCDPQAAVADVTGLEVSRFLTKLVVSDVFWGDRTIGQGSKTVLGVEDAKTLLQSALIPSFEVNVWDSSDISDFEVFKPFLMNVMISVVFSMMEMVLEAERDSEVVVY